MYVLSTPLSYRNNNNNIIVWTYLKDKKEEMNSSVDNQSLRDDLVSKLSLFRDYKIIQGNAIAADSNAEDEPLIVTLLSPGVILPLIVIVIATILLIRQRKSTEE